MAKIRNFDSFWGLYCHISAPINVKFNSWERTFGKKPIFEPLSINNIGMTAALRAGLLVKIIKSDITQ